MSDQTERLRIIIETLGAELNASELKQVATGLRDTAKEADKAGRGVREAGREMAQAGQTAGVAGLQVRGLARELAQGDWRGAAFEMATMRGALSAMGNVAGVAAAGVLALGVAYYQGYQESKQFNQSLILTGNYAGLVAGQLDGMSQRLARSVNSTVGGARETLQALVTSGKFTGDTLEAAGRAIELVAKYSGRSRADVVADFAKMSEGVTKWAVNANQQYHFLTLAQYEHIKALERQGRTSEAARVALEAMSTSMGTTIQPALGSAERAWNALEQAASRAWDAMKGVGRPESIETRLANARRLVETTAFELAQARRLAPSTVGPRQENFDAARASLSGLEYTAARDRRAAVERSMAAQEAEKAIAEAEKKGRTGAPRIDPEIEARRRLRSELSGYAADYEKEVYRLVYLRDKEGLSVERFNEEIQKLVTSQPGQVAAARERADLAKKEADHLRDLERTRAQNNQMAERALEAQEREMAAMVAGNAQLELQAQQVGLTTAELAKLTLARIDAAIAEEQLTLVGKQNDGNPVEIAMIERKIRLLERQRELTKDLTDKQAADELKKQTEADSKKFSEDLRRDVTDSLQRAFESGKNPAEALASTLSSMIKTRLTRALAEAIANPILKPLEQALGGAGGGGGDLFGGLLKFMQGSGGILPGDFVSMGLHSGGMVGAEATFMRSIGAPSFAHANRFHGGGLVGGEVPIIAKKGEGVFTEGQMKALAPVGAAAPQVTVNVHTLQGQTASVQQRQGRDGLNIDVIVQQIEDQLAGNIAAGSGAIGQAIEGRYNLRTAVV